MKKLILFAITLTALATSAFAGYYHQTIHTDQGDITWEIYDNGGSYLEATGTYPDGSTHHMTGYRRGNGEVEWTMTD